MLCNELLKDSPKAFRQLHKLYGFDFESDFVYYKHNGNFTVNAIIKNASSQTGAQLNIIDYKMVLLVKPFLEYGEQNVNTWCLVDISGIYDGLDYFFTSSDFHAERKDKKVKAVLIAQKVELLKPEKAKYLNYAERYSVTDIYTSSYNYKKYISRVKIKDCNGWKTELRQYKRDIKTVDDMIDKSGYIISERRKDLKCRAEAIRAEREKAEFLKADLSKYLQGAEKQIEDVKSIVSGYISKAQTSADISKINFYKLETVFSLYERLTSGIQEKTFTSINGVEHIYNDICEYVENIKNALSC